jgi:predicted bacteriocin transport accessory protein
VKNFFKKIGNFFKKIGLFIWKYLKVGWNYIKENAWLQPIALVLLIFGLVFGFQAIVDGVEKIKATNEEKKAENKNKYIKLTMEQVEEKLDNKEDFALFIGAHDCVYCQDFKSVVNKYIDSTGKMIYYIDIHDTSDSSIDNKVLVEWAERLQDIDTRDFDGSLSTPTVVVIRSGEFADAKSGAQGLSGGTDYLNFVKFVEGGYIDKVEATA